MTSQQPPARPWFRLATMAPRSVPVPAPTSQPDPVPQPRPIAIRPAFRVNPPQTQETAAAAAPQAPVAVPLPPVATDQVLQLIVAPGTRSAPTASAPATPLSPITDAAPAPSPTTREPPATTNKSSSTSTLSPVSAAPKASPTPTTLSVPSSSSFPQSPIPKVASPLAPKVYSPAPKTISQVQASAPKPSPYKTASTNAPETVGILWTTETTSTSFPKPINSQPKTPSPSPSNRHIVQPPSPLTLPPAQLKSDDQELKFAPEFEQKAVLVQETNERPKAYNNEPFNTRNAHRGDRETSKKPHHKDKGNHNNNISNPDSSGMRIVTVAGDNKGAVMELRPSLKRDDYFSNNLGKFRTWGEGEKSKSDSSSSSEEGSSKRNDKNETMTKELSVPYVNSNVQAVNNSILFNATCTHHDPGVHISLSRGGRGSKVKKHMNMDD